MITACLRNDAMSFTHFLIIFQPLYLCLFYVGFRVVRRVSFADNVGLELASIRIMTEGRDTPPDLDRFNALRFGESKIPQWILQPQFLQPIQDFNTFYHRLNTNCVALESISIHNNVLTGVVKVCNIAYEKRVAIHYSTDEWKTKKLFLCYYVNTMPGAATSCKYDAFSFQMEIDGSCERFDFCVQYLCAGKEFWDNNNERNFTLLRMLQ